MVSTSSSVDSNIIALTLVGCGLVDHFIDMDRVLHHSRLVKCPRSSIFNQGGQKSIFLRSQCVPNSKVKERHDVFVESSSW